MFRELEGKKVQLRLRLETNRDSDEATIEPLFGLSQINVTAQER